MGIRHPSEHPRQEGEVRGVQFVHASEYCVHRERGRGPGYVY